MKFFSLDKVRTGRKLRMYMELSGIGPRDIQEYLSLSCVQTVYRWMQGINVPTIDNLYAMSRLFHVRMDDLVEGNEACGIHSLYERETGKQAEQMIGSERSAGRGAA